jgi:porin
MIAASRLAMSVVAALMLATDGAADEPASSASDRTSWLERPVLTGDWWGARDQLAATGVVVEPALTQFYQGLAAGDGDHEFEYGGKAEFLLTVDLGKLGLWNGLSAVVHGEYNYGRTPAFAGGALLPNNTAMAFPYQNEDGGDLTSVFLRQRFGQTAALTVGKINMVDSYGSAREFSGGRGIEKFQHIAFVAPVTGIVPAVIFGAIGTVTAPHVTFSLMVYDPKSALTRTGFEDPFEEGVALSGSVQLASRWLQRSGKHVLTAIWSSQDGINLRNLPDVNLPAGSADRLSKTRERYYFSYAFEQTLGRSQADPRKAFGLFGQASVSDGNPNPLAWSVLGGVGGASPIPGRSGDTLGAAAFYYAVSGDLVDNLRGILRGREYGAEIFYNMAVTPWLRVTADLQVVSPALAGHDLAVILGVRAQIRL